MSTRILSILIILLCGIAAWQSTIIPESMMNTGVGAKLSPLVVVICLSGLALLYLFLAYKDRMPDVVKDEDQMPLEKCNQRILFFLAGGVALIGLIKFIGFLVSATLCGSLIARSFDAPLNIKNLLICAAIALIFWCLFSLGLGVELGPLFSIKI